MANRFILRYQATPENASGEVTLASHTQRVRSIPGVRIVDETPSMLLVSGPAKKLREFAASSTDWKLFTERMIALPEPRPQVKIKATATRRAKTEVVRTLTTVSMRTTKATAARASEAASARTPKAASMRTARAARSSKPAR